jgi:hypothetical protein
MGRSPSIVVAYCTNHETFVTEMRARVCHANLKFPLLPRMTITVCRVVYVDSDHLRSLHTCTRLVDFATVTLRCSYLHTYEPLCM